MTAQETKAASVRASITRMRDDVRRLSEPGVLGFYDRFEATELLGFRKGQPPVNLFSLFVGEEGDVADSGGEQIWLNPQPLQVKGLKDWRFGLLRYSLTQRALDDALTRLVDTNRWNPSGDSLAVGPLEGRKPQFAPPDSYNMLPWNRLLKNNFWNGSYVVELVDPVKAALPDFWAKPVTLQALSSAIAGFAPFGIAGLPDRLGNVILQLPITTLIARFQLSQADRMSVDVAWHPRATPRPLRASCEITYDGLVSDFGAAEVTQGTVSLTLGRNLDPHRGLVWDDANCVLLAATSPSQFIHFLTMSMSVGWPGSETRNFFSPDADALKPVRAHPEFNDSVRGRFSSWGDSLGESRRLDSRCD